MKINADTKLYCLIGNPISKSLSPIIHNFIFEHCSINAKYLAFNVNSSEDLEKAVAGVKALGISGVNVTIPYKIEIMKYLRNEIDEKAKVLGAINTVSNMGGKLKGYNTDGDGFIKSLKDKGMNIRNKKAAIIGAGGVAHSIAVSLVYEGIKELLIINRNLQNAQKLHELVNKINSGVCISCYTLDQVSKLPKDIDLLINTTPVGMYPNVEDMPIHPELFSSKTFFYDIIYKPANTRFVLEAKKLGYKTMSGLDMLINQAIYSQQIWNNELFNGGTDWSYIKEEIITKI